MQVTTTRQAEHPVDNRFIARWSPRAFAAEPVPDEHLGIMLEAARWAPSSMNAQPWRFFVATGGAGRARLDEAILAGNRAWSDAAPAIIWVVAKTTFEDGQTNRHAWFDTGAATIQLILQANQMGYHSHHMGGIEAHQAAQALGLDNDHEVVCAVALGRRGDPTTLPEWAHAREVPSVRKSQDQFVQHL